MLPKDAEILNLLAKEDYEGAINLYGFKYEVGDIQAKAVVQSYLHSHEDELTERRAMIKASAEKNEHAEQDVLAKLTSGNVRDAEQRYQDHYGCSMYEAQMSVEQIRREHFPDLSTLPLANQLFSRTYLFVAIGLILLVLLLIYIF